MAFGLTTGIFVCRTNPLGKDHLDLVAGSTNGRIRPYGIFIPGFAVAGTLCSLALAVWLLIAIPYAIARRREIEPWDWLMMAGTVMVILALVAPDTFFASR